MQKFQGTIRDRPICANYHLSDRFARDVDRFETHEEPKRVSYELFEVDVTSVC